MKRLHTTGTLMSMRDKASEAWDRRELAEQQRRKEALERVDAQARVEAQRAAAACRRRDAETPSLRDCERRLYHALDAIGWPELVDGVTGKRTKRGVEWVLVRKVEDREWKHPDWGMQKIGEDEVARAVFESRGKVKVRGAKNAIPGLDIRLRMAAMIRWAEDQRA